MLGEKYQLSLGLRHRVNNFLFTFGVTENLQNINNTPDIGFQLGLAWVPLSFAARPLISPLPRPINAGVALTPAFLFAWPFSHGRLLSPAGCFCHIYNRVCFNVILLTRHLVQE